MSKNHLNYIFSLIILACLFASVPIFASACTGIEQAANSVKNKASEVISQLNSSNNITLTPPSSSYPADIIGSVTIAKNVIGVDMSKLLSGWEFWIVKISIRNKTYQAPITSAPNWSIFNASCSLVVATSMNILPGKSGDAILCFMIIGGLNPNDYQIVYGGQDPKPSMGKLTKVETIDLYNWNLQKPVTLMVNNLPQGSKYPKGTYTSTAMGMSQTATFTEDTVKRYDPIDGEAIFTYRYYIRMGQNDFRMPTSIQEVNTIWVQDVVTKEAQYIDFKYIPEQDIVVIANISYYKQ